MPNDHNRHSEHILLMSRFRYAHRRFLYGRAQLYPDRIELFGLHWTGIHRRTIALREVVRLSWRTDTARSANMTLYLRDEEPVRLWITGAGLWKHQIDARLGKRLNVTDELPGSMTSASAA